MSKVKRVSADQIPVIDISSLVLGEADIEAAKSLHHASQNLGFLYVTGHGMDSHLINQLYQSGRQKWKTMPYQILKKAIFGGLKMLTTLGITH
jgi:hypothetical protein